MVNFGEILRFDPEQVQEIFSLCNSRQQTCDDLTQNLNKLTQLHTWDGDAAKAAKEAAGKTHSGISEHRDQAWKIAAAAKDCYNEANEMKDFAKKILADADAQEFNINPDTDQVTDTRSMNMQGWPEADRQQYYKERTAMREALQNRVTTAITRATAFDNDLAAAINAADGEIPLTTKGEKDDFNPADRKANQVAAYRKLYGHDPKTPNDWRMAEALDLHSYSSKYEGLKPNAVVGRIKSIPGGGLVRTNLYIKTREAQNFGGHHLFHLLPHNLGDLRSADPNAAAEDSRVSLYIDYDKGIIVARQSPLVTSDGYELAKVGTPEVSAIQDDKGAVRLRYLGMDPYEPKLGQLGKIGVGGDVTFQPNNDGSISAAGQITNYPSAEIYHYPGDGSGSPETLVDYRANGSQAGAAGELPQGLNNHIGTSNPDHGINPRQGVLPALDPINLYGTKLRSINNPATIQTIPSQ